MEEKLMSQRLNKTDSEQPTPSCSAGYIMQNLMKSNTKKDFGCIPTQQKYTTLKSQIIVFQPYTANC